MDKFHKTLTNGRVIRLLSYSEKKFQTFSINKITQINEDLK